MLKITKQGCLVLIFMVLGSMNIGGVMNGTLISDQNNIFSNSGNKIISGGSSPLGTSKISSVTVYQNQLPMNANQKSWTELGPRPLYSPNKSVNLGPIVAGRITSIAVNQTNPDIIYAGSSQGGVWKTTDGGKTWVPLMDSQQSLAVGSITISPDGKTIFVGTGEPNFPTYDSYAGNGLLKSTDEGKTWEVLGSEVFDQSSISGIVINSTNPSWITVSTAVGTCCKGLNISYNSNGIGVFYSTNGGQTWLKTNINGKFNSSYTGIVQLVPDPVNNSNMYAADYHGGVWQSLDSGKNWTRMQIPYLINNPGRIAIAISKSNPNLLFVTVVDSFGGLGTFNMYNLKSGNNTILPGIPLGNPCNKQCWYNLVMAVDPVNTNILYFGGSKLYRSTDQGLSWTSILNKTGYDFHAFTFKPNDPSSIFVGNDEGLYSSTDRGSTWINLNTNLGINPFTSIAASPTNDSLIIGGTQSNGCDQYNNSTYWNVKNGGDGGSALFLNDNEIICNQQNIRIFASNDGGTTWHNSATGISTSDKHLFYPPMVQDYKNRSIIYFGTDHLYKSIDFGVSWNVSSSLQSNSTISTIALSSSDQNVIAVGDINGTVRMTTNGGQSWTTILDMSNLTRLRISSIAVDPRESSHLFVSLTESGNQRLLETNNSGGSWQVIQNLGQIPQYVAINVLKYNPVSKTLFVGTDRGLYYYNGTSFYTLGSGLPNAAVWDLTFTHSNYLVVATHGRGAWINYMTPEIIVDGLTNYASVDKGTAFTVTVTDPNGLDHALYNWNDGVNHSISVITTTLIVPSNQTNLILRIYAQDPAGNWASKSFILNPDTHVNLPPLINTDRSIPFTQSGNNVLPSYFVPTMLIVAFGVMAVIVIVKRRK